jgi:CysZ protein
VSLITDFARALAQIGDRRFMAVLLKGLGLTIAGLALVFWAVVAGLGWLLPEAVVLPWIGEVGFVDSLVSWAAVGLMLVLSVVLMVPVAAIVVGFFLDDIAAAVEAEHYPRLPPVDALPLSVQILDGLRFFGVLVGANLVAVVIYFGVPPLAPFVFWLVNGYLLGREYFQLVTMRRLGPEGAAALRRRHGARIWLAGVLMAVPLSVPVVNLLVPVLGVAVFTHQFHRLARA